ncbi:hypothetical protein PCASD_24243 [Puccinia coronata f. sp. avenae]|uniref:Uncharacterized protein n=1 Tax=Puccinia coronata f. sp. avenae TaxID=200324 RepID=A0A2N5THP3_9BASI|nr:hypothetical protein PCASD_24243 [Puccinia coronata f. sp. avenae]
MCAEAGLPAPDPLIKRCAILAACRLMSVPENHILYPLMPWRRQAAYNMCRGSNYAPRWTKSIAPPRLKYLQLDGVLNHILPLVDPTNPTRPTKAAVRAFLTRFTLEDFDRRPNPPYTYPARAPTTTGPKGLLPPHLAKWVTTVRLGHGWFPQYLNRIGRHTGKCPWCRTPSASREHLLVSCRAKPNNTDELIGNLSFHELVYDDTHFATFLSAVTANGVGLYRTIQADLIPSLND